jgi:hypothetical protein
VGWHLPFVPECLPQVSGVRLASLVFGPRSLQIL